MKNILKLTGVSMLAIVVANGANAAGYTCEELIEYTSCNPGYYMPGEESCPNGYDWGETWCIKGGDDDKYAVDGYDEELCEDLVDCKNWCAEVGGTWLGAGCIDRDTVSDASERPYTDGDFISASFCIECPAGSICSGDTAGATPCPAGSYCAGTGLSAVSGECAIGTYSTGGAVSCSTCPATDLTDKDGATVVATTLTTGATTPSACVVGEEHYFTDAKGTYHFKSDCGLKLWHMTIKTQAECESLGTDWYWDDDRCFNDDAILTTTEEQCLSEIEEYGMVGGIEWVDGKCTCSSSWLIDSYGMYCY